MVGHESGFFKDNELPKVDEKTINSLKERDVGNTLIARITNEEGEEARTWRHEWEGGHVYHTLVKKGGQTIGYRLSYDFNEAIQSQALAEKHIRGVK